MKQTTIKLTGPIYWAQVFEDIRDMTGAVDPTGTPYDPDIRDKNEGQYKLGMSSASDGYDELQKTDSQVSERDGPDGPIVTFKRMHKKYSRAGKLLDFASGAPKVTFQGKAWDFGEDGPIYNGSIAEVTVNVYGEGRFCGTRLESVNVLQKAVPEEKIDEVSTVEEGELV